MQKSCLFDFVTCAQSSLRYYLWRHEPWGHIYASYTSPSNTPTPHPSLFKLQNHSFKTDLNT